MTSSERVWLLRFVNERGLQHSPDTYFFADVGKMAFLCNAHNTASTKTRNNLLPIWRLPKCSYCWLDTWSGDSCTDAQLKIESASDDEINFLLLLLLLLLLLFFIFYFILFYGGEGRGGHVAEKKIWKFALASQATRTCRSLYFEVRSNLSETGLVTKGIGSSTNNDWNLFVVHGESEDN